MVFSRLWWVATISLSWNRICLLQETRIWNCNFCNRCLRLARHLTAEDMRWSTPADKGCCTLNEWSNNECLFRYCPVPAWAIIVVDLWIPGYNKRLKLTGIRLSSPVVFQQMVNSCVAVSRVRLYVMHSQPAAPVPATKSDSKNLKCCEVSTRLSDFHGLTYKERPIDN